MTGMGGRPRGRLDDGTEGGAGRRDIRALNNVARAATCRDGRRCRGPSSHSHIVQQASHCRPAGCPCALGASEAVDQPSLDFCGQRTRSHSGWGAMGSDVGDAPTACVIGRSHDGASSHMVLGSVRDEGRRLFSTLHWMCRCVQWRSASLMTTGSTSSAD